MIERAQDLGGRPSRADTDDYGPVLGVLEDWLGARGVLHRRGGAARVHVPRGCGFGNRGRVGCVA
ncbi:hypothetical protein CG736_00090 [Kitasatospora sp. CB02891]|nr:hypothetical protein CG736_00090 [Kitasatospora sp. CB02891]